MKANLPPLINQAIITKAVDFLRKGELVAFPTETVYGLGADASNTEALYKLYALKGRPAAHPVIVHLASIEQINDWCIDLPDYAKLLIQSFCPGPLTIIAKKSPMVSSIVTGGQDTIGLRIPAHPTAQTLLKAFGGGIAAPSANKYGRVSPTSARHVGEEFSDQISLIIDGGNCTVGIESTIVDVTRLTPTILRPGIISEKEILKCLGLTASHKLSHQSEQKVRVPGSDKIHYAPHTPVYLLDRDSLIKHLKQNTEQSFAILAFDIAALVMSDPGHSIRQYIQGQNEPALYARDLYANLRQLDRVGADSILIEAVPDTIEWLAIADRLKRASAK